MAVRQCPKCDAEMEHLPADPEVGIMSGAWACSSCDTIVEEEDYDFDDES